MIILYNENETSFTSMGLGAITDAVSCIVAESTDGSFELELEYPIDGDKASLLTFRRIIFSQTTPLGVNETFNQNGQPFRIYDISEPIGGTFTVRARHVSYDMTGLSVNPFSSDSTTPLDDAIDGLPSHIFPASESNKFTITTEYHPETVETSEETSENNKTKKFEMTTPQTLRNVLFDKIANKFEYCVWKFDKFSATLYSDGRDGSRPDDPTRGHNNGVALYYGKHFTDITQERNNSLVVSAIYPYWGSSASSTKSVSSILLAGLQSYASGDMNLSKIVQNTGLDIETVRGYVEEYMSNEPHSVDLSAIGGKTTGGESTQTGTDTHTQTIAGTTSFVCGYGFTEVTKITVNDKGTNNYTYDAATRTVTLANAPELNATIKITGSMPSILTIPGKIYAPEGYTTDHVNILPVDLSSEFSELPTEDDLLQKAAEYWKDNKLGEPTVSLSINYNDPHHISEFMNIDNFDNIRLCDTVTVVFMDKGIKREVQINKIEYDALNDRIISIDLGEPKRTLAKTINALTKKETKTSTNNTTIASIGETVTSRTTLYRRCSSNSNPPSTAETSSDKWQEAKPAATTTLPYLWQKTLVEYSTGRAESIDFVCIETGEATATSKAESQTVYLISNEGRPSAPTGWVTETGITSKNTWTKNLPNPIIHSEYEDPYIYYYCEQTKAVNGAVTNGGIMQDGTADIVLDWADISGDEVKINGGRISANSIFASSIVANSITASQLAVDLSLQSVGYLAPDPESDEPYSRRGMRLSLANNDTAIITPSFVLDTDGNAYLKGTITANEGSKISELLIVDDDLHTGDSGTMLKFLQSPDGTTGASAETLIGRYDLWYRNGQSRYSSSQFHVDTSDYDETGGGEIKINIDSYKALGGEDFAQVFSGLIDNSGLVFKSYEHSGTIDTEVASFEMDSTGGILDGTWRINDTLYLFGNEFPVPDPDGFDDGKYLKVSGGKYVLGEGGGGGSSGVSSVTTGDNNGQIKVIPAEGTAYNVNVKGLGSAAYTNANAYAPTVHYHDAGSVEIDNTTIVGDDDGVIGFSTTWGDGRYSLTSHNHAGVYSPVGHTHPLSDIMFGSSKIDGGNINHDSSLDDTDGILSLSTTWLNTRYSQTGHTHTKSQITDFPTSMPASDVYSWAKASTKPSYTYSEVGAAPLSHDHAASEIIHDNTLAADENDELGVNTTWADGRYSLTSHNHTGVYSPVGHTHTGVYAPSQHAHQGSDIDHDSTLTVTSDGDLSVSTTWLNNNYAQKTHTHTKSQITDFPTSMPASDVYSWAKASIKPSYVWTEIGSKPTWIGDSKPTYTYSEVGAAASNHNHTGTYAPIQHSHDAGSIEIDSTSIIDTGDGVIGFSTTWGDNRYATKTHTHTKSQITDFPTSMPASDVYSWAKASTKPSYTYSEVGAPSTTGANASGTWGINITGESQHTFNLYSYAGNECSIGSQNGALNSDLWFNYRAYYGGETTEGVELTDYYFGNRHGSWAKTKVHAGTFDGDLTGNATSATYATTAGSAPASDVYSWAKASTKPSYTYSEVGAAASNHNHTGVYAPAQHAHQGSEIDHDSTLVTTSDGELSVNSNKFFMDFGPNPTTGIGGGIVQPGGAAARSIRTADGGSRDVGIFYLSQDNAYIANSSDNCYSFAVFDTDLTTDFSNPSNASFAVASNGGGCLIRGNTVIHSGNIGSQSVAYATSAGSAPQRTIKVNGSNYITDNTTPFDIVQGNHITIRKPSTGRIIIDYDSTCLLEGTLITMADGTQKPIEEIQNGDEIKSYDPTTGEIISAYALDLECTGSTNEYKYTIFDDGSEIVTYGNHSLYSSDLGYPKDIEKWQLGDKGINIDGDAIEMLDQGIVRYKGTWKKHYVLYSSNNLYFANDILTCHWGSTKYKHLKDFDIFDKLPETVKDTFEEEEHKYGDKGQWMLSKEYVTELVNIRKRRNTLSKLIDDCKKKLNETDYVGQKYLEGLITAVEWLKHKTDRAGWRKLINDNETELASLESQITTLKRKYRTPLTQRKRFAEYVTMCNSVFDDLTQYYKRG